MRSNRFITLVLVAGLLLGTSPVWAGPSPEERWQELDQKIRILERKLELEKEAAGKEAAKHGVVEAGEKGFAIRSQDGSWQLKLRGYVQADGRVYLDDNRDAVTNDLLLRRVRPIIEGTLGKDYQFRIMPDFGRGKTELLDAYIQANYWPAAQVRVGKFKAPVGLERLQSGASLLFVERALPTSLVPNRDVGLQIGGELAKGTLSYALGLFNGGVDGGSTDSDSNDDKDLAARLFAHPFKTSGIAPLQGLGIGVAGSYGNQEGALPSFKSGGQQTFFKYLATSNADGRRWRVAPQAYWYAGPVGLLAEYVRSEQEVSNGTITRDLANQAWQVAASWVVTGEDASFKGVKPKRSFDPKSGAWGALELAGRYNELEIDQDAFPLFADPTKYAEKASAWAAGLNWYPSRNLKVVVNYEQTTFDQGSASGDRETEKVLLTRVQVAY
ncbi:porin [Desulfuromonas carbonis]|uniref:OprO/OprP family phosphate-selective porin n=1 Tax=Desulfuromonas sp. DDH964 TaxID=1823759 RepID=UPI00078DB8DB|nr:porin [Desulfuromonas sp. DDH964]AMV70531.1 Porin P precursor [Desulfuromonas sp. DDH964]